MVLGKDLRWFYSFKQFKSAFWEKDQCSWLFYQMAILENSWSLMTTPYYLFKQLYVSRKKSFFFLFLIFYADKFIM